MAAGTVMRFMVKDAMIPFVTERRFPFLLKTTNVVLARWDLILAWWV